MTHPYLPTQYQQFIHISRYARWLDDEGRRETWEETVNRYFDFFEGHLDKYHGYQLTPELREELSQAILNLEVMPSMRALMTAGPALEREACAGFNCSALPIDSVRSFDELMYILLCGTGVGFSVERQYVSKLPVINEHFENSVTTIVVEDSKAGWARALRELISLLYSGQIPRWDMSRVRPAGARLKTFGGRASGPEPLEDLFKFAVNLFKNAAGRKLTSLEAHDLVCKIGDVVVSGGVRRCLPEGTLVKTTEGPVAIEAIQPGMKVDTPAGLAVVANVFDQGKQDTVEIIHEFGSFECTADHRMAVYDSLTSWTFKKAKDLTTDDTLVWDFGEWEGTEGEVPQVEMTRDLPNGSYTRSNGREERTSRYSDIACAIDGCKKGALIKNYKGSGPICSMHYQRIKHHGSPLKFRGWANEVVLPAVVNEDLAWLVGLIQGDGYNSEEHSKSELDFAKGAITIACSPTYPGVIEKAQRILEDICPQSKVRIERRESDNCVRIRLSSARFTKWLTDHVKKPNISMNVPDWIKNAPARVRKAYLAGLFDADGNFTKTNSFRLVDSIYPEFLEDVAQVAMTLGVALKVKLNRPAVDNWHALYKLEVTGLDFKLKLLEIMEEFSAGKFSYGDVEFRESMYSRSVRHANLVDDFVTHVAMTDVTRDSTNTLPIRVLGIKKGRNVQTYDIEVEGIHQFTANGFVTHNSALISLSNLSDDRMRHAKSGAWWETHPHRALANNSVAYTDKPDIGIFMDEWKALYDSKSGERGIFNREAARKQVERIGRRDPDHEWLVNPCCVLGDTLLMTTEGPRRIDELEGTPFTALVDGHKYDAPHGSWRSGVGDVYRLSTKEGFVLDLTPEHRILTAGRGWVEAKDLKPGDAIVINDHRDIGSWGRIDNFGDGYLLGLSAENKHDIRAFETESSEFYRGFLRGLFDAKGYVEGWKEISTPSGDKGLSVRLGQSNLEFLRSVQRMLLRLGIASRIYDAKEAGFQDSAEKAWRLVIRDNHVRRFAEVVGFTNTVKAQNLQSALQRHKTYNKPFIAHVDTFEYLGRFEVWDAHVDEVHAFDANGIYAHNSEILLRPYQMCNLSEVIVRPDDTVETLKRKVRLAAILGTFQSTLTHYKYLRKVWKNNAEEERLLGVSLTGQLDNELFNGRLGLDKTAEALRELKEVVVATNADLAEKIGIPQSTAVSAVKPSGCRPGEALTTTDEGIYTLDELLEDHPADQEWHDFVRAKATNGDKITKTYRNGVADVFKIKTNFGIEFESTANHQWFVVGGYENGRRISNREPNWVRTDALRPGDVIDIKPGVYNKSEDVSLNTAVTGLYRNVVTRKLPQVMSPDLAWLLGYLWGDGTLSPHKKRLRFMDNRLANLEKAARILKEQFGLNVNINKASEGRDAHVIEVASAEVWAFFALNGIWKYSDSGLADIPRVVRESSYESIIAFIAGLVDSDGWVGVTNDKTTSRVMLTTSYDAFSNHIQHVALAVGLGFGRSLNSQGENLQQVKHMWLMSNNGHSVPERFDLLKKHSVKLSNHNLDLPFIHERKHPVRPLGRVVSVEYARTVDTFDVEVESSHWYYAGAVKSHNTVSQLTDTASGMHARHSEYYLRTVRGAKHDPLTQFMIDSGFPVEDDVMKPDTTVVFTFPQKAPEGAITRDQLTAIEHLELWMVYQKNWCEHKASITVSVREHEWLEVGAWVYKNFDEISGVSFLPYTDHSYRQAPYQECSKEEYLEFLKKMPTVDWSLLSEYEKEDNTSGNQTLSCSAGVCEIVDIT